MYLFHFFLCSLQFYLHFFLSQIAQEGTNCGHAHAINCGQSTSIPPTAVYKEMPAVTPTHSYHGVEILSSMKSACVLVFWVEGRAKAKCFFPLSVGNCYVFHKPRNQKSILVGKKSSKKFLLNEAVKFPKFGTDGLYNAYRIRKWKCHAKSGYSDPPLQNHCLQKKKKKKKFYWKQRGQYHRAIPLLFSSFIARLVVKGMTVYRT